jgi:hypothetical protein
VRGPSALSIFSQDAPWSLPTNTFPPFVAASSRSFEISISIVFVVIVTISSLSQAFLLSLWLYFQRLVLLSRPQANCCVPSVHSSWPSRPGNNYSLTMVQIVEDGWLTFGLNISVCYEGMDACCVLTEYVSKSHI